MVARNEKERDIEGKMKDFEARLRAQLAAETRVPAALHGQHPLSGPPPAPYEMERPVGMNAIRSIKRDD
jgi:hypothetical protein